MEEVKLVTEYLAEDSTILAYKLLSVDAGYTYFYCNRFAWEGILLG